MEARSFPLEKLTSLRIGGPAERFAEPGTEAELVRVLGEAAGDGLRVRAIGGGKNLLVSDQGVDGLVVSLRRLTGMRRVDDLLVTGAGVSTRAFVQRAINEGLSGFECLVGVPGTMGGAARMNAGGVLGCIGNRIEFVRGYTRGGAPYLFPRESCEFGYRTSNLAETFVTEVAVRMEPTRADLKARTRKIFSEKRRMQPLFDATAGCMFKNPALPGGESAGLLLDRAGAKGISVGGAAFSTVHANFVLNLGGATCRDVMEVLEAGHQRVFDHFGVDLKLEVEIWKKEEAGALRVA